MATTTQSHEAKSAPASAKAGQAADPDAVRRAAGALNVLVFVSGAILMGVEIAGSRILAPSFGTSIFVWGSLIGLFMSAMALGYYFGGRQADKHPSFTILVGIVIVAGLYTLLVIPYWGAWVCELVALSFTHRMLGPLLASAVLFFLPIFLLAMVTPYAVKLKATSLAGVGGLAGWLSALSTAGSIVGTLGTTFVLIPLFRVSNVLQGLSVALAVCGVASYIVFRRAARGGGDGGDRRSAAVLALIALAMAELWVLFPIQPHVAPGQRLIRYLESEYHDISVTELVLDPSGGWTGTKNGFLTPHQIPRWLKFNENTESGIYPYRGEYVNAVGYTDLLHLPLIWRGHPKRLLVIGGGGAVIPTQYCLHYPSIEQVDVLELDPRVEEVARRYFQVPDDPRIKFHIGDARRNLRQLPPSDRYDVVVLDAYSSGGQIPFHLLTWEFLHEVREHLAEDGVLATNIITAVRNGTHTERPADLFLAEYATLKASEAEVRRMANPEPAQKEPLFKQVYVFPRVRKGDEILRGYEDVARNVIVVATRESQPRGGAEIAETARELTPDAAPTVRIPASTFRWHAEQLYDRGPKPEEWQGVPTLSDEYAPVDTMYRPIKIEETWVRLY